MKRKLMIVVLLLFVYNVLANAVLLDSSAHLNHSDGKGKNTLHFVVNGVSFNMIAVKGKVSRELNSNKTMVENFYIGKTEVTQALWQAVMGNNPSYFTGDESLPVEQVSWEDCQSFIARLNCLTGKTFRLPTEAEWEYAACGGAKRKDYKYSGGNKLMKIAWCDDNSIGQTHPVAKKKSNELGIHDMSGNVWEWCHDDYFLDDGNSIDTEFKSIRGGSWINKDWCCQSCTRSYYLMSEKSFYVGFRLAL